MERLSIKDVVGTDVRSRISLDAVKALMAHDGEYVIDMKGVTSISVADELYNLQQDYGAVRFEHQTEFVQRMMSIVWKGRSKKRVREEEDVEMMDMTSIEDFSRYLLSI